MSILPDDVGLGCKPVSNIGHVAHIDCGAAHHFHRKIVDLGNALRTGIHIDVIFELPYFERARRQNQVLGSNGADHVGGRQALRLQLRKVEIDHDLALFAAVGIRDRRARNGHQLGSQKVQANVIQFLFLHILAGERELENGHAGGVVDDNQRRIYTRRHLPEDGLRNRGHLRDAGGHVGRGL